MPMARDLFRAWCALPSADTVSEICVAIERGDCHETNLELVMNKLRTVFAVLQRFHMDPRAYWFPMYQSVVRIAELYYLRLEKCLIDNAGGGTGAPVYADIPHGVRTGNSLGAVQNM